MEKLEQEQHDAMRVLLDINSQISYALNALSDGTWELPNYIPNLNWDNVDMNKFTDTRVIFSIQNITTLARQASYHLGKLEVMKEMGKQQ